MIDVNEQFEWPKHYDISLDDVMNTCRTRIMQRAQNRNISELVYELKTHKYKWVLTVYFNPPEPIS